MCSYMLDIFPTIKLAKVNFELSHSESGGTQVILFQNVSEKSVFLFYL